MPTLHSIPTGPFAPPPGSKVITLGGGCFWCVQSAIHRIKGVLDTDVGYCNGDEAKHPSPSYQDVCTGTTGHVEAVRVAYDPAILPLPKLLSVFFTVHDPTQLNRQGGDVGTQYRSAILLNDPADAGPVKAFIAAAAGDWSSPIVTQVEPAGPWHVAEEYHQHYFDKDDSRPGYCQFVVRKKVEKVAAAFAADLK